MKIGITRQRLHLAAFPSISKACMDFYNITHYISFLCPLFSNDIRKRGMEFETNSRFRLLIKLEDTD